MNSESIRQQFPQLSEKVHGKDFVYFDSAASALKPKKVIDAITHHYAKEASNIHRGVHYFSEYGTTRFEQTREAVKTFINAPKLAEIIFTSGTTESLNLVAYSYAKNFIKKDQTILLSQLEHHSNIVPWQLIQGEIGYKIKAIPLTDSGEINLAEYKILLKENDVALVSCSHVSNSLGVINPVKEMIELAHQNKAKFCVDGAQAIPHLKVDVADLNCDFYCFSGHKMYGPTGVGVLYGKEELLEMMPPFMGGGDMIDTVRFEKTTFNDLPHKFEAGTPNIASVIALDEAVSFLSEIGMDTVSAHEKELMEFTTAELNKIHDLTIFAETKNKCGAISFALKGAHHHDLGTLLDQQGIAVRTGHHCTQPLMEHLGVTGTTRISFGIYNNKEEIVKFINALKKAQELL